MMTSEGCVHETSVKSSCLCCSDTALVISSLPGHMALSQLGRLLTYSLAWHAVTPAAWSAGMMGSELFVCTFG